MANRITEKDLERLVNRLNQVTKSPSTYSDTQPGGTFAANVGHYYIDHAYGGVELLRVSNSRGGVSAPLGQGHVPKRELYGQISAFLSGIEGAQS